MNGEKLLTVPHIQYRGDMFRFDNILLSVSAKWILAKAIIEKFCTTARTTVTGHKVIFYGIEFIVKCFINQVKTEIRVIYC